MRCEDLQANETCAVGADNGHHIVSRQGVVAAGLRLGEDAGLVVFIFAQLDLVARRRVLSAHEAFPNARCATCASHQLDATAAGYKSRRRSPVESMAKKMMKP